MTIARQVAAVSSSIESATRAEEFTQFAKFVAIRQTLPLGPEMDAARAKLSPRCQSILKAAVAPGTTSNMSALADYSSIAASFLESLRGKSVFDTALAAGMKRVPLRSRVAVVAAVAGASPSENAMKPISALDVGPSDVAPRKALAIVVATDELMKLSGAAPGLFDAELKNGVAVATDSVFLTALLATVTPTASAGSSTANVRTDFAALLGALVVGADSKIIVAMSPANALKLLLKTDTSGASAFPLLTPTGGQIYNGITVVPTTSAPPGVILAIDAMGLAGNSESIELRTASQAALEFESEDSPPVDAGTILQSLWQTGSRALLAERFFGFAVVRSGAVSAISGAAY